MPHPHYTRRQFLHAGLGAAAATAVAPLLGCEGRSPGPRAAVAADPVVSIVRVKGGRTDLAVEIAIDLLGGIDAATGGRERILLKPNLVADSPDFTTKRPVIETLARLMQRTGKEVLIGEGSAAAGGFNVKEGVTYRTRKQDLLDAMQSHVFERLGYAELAKDLRVPLINLHSGKMAEVPLADGHVFDELTVHEELTDIDLLCSVPMMKTHVLATVTLSMKNLIGLYPGTRYYSVRSWLHDRAAEAGSPGVAYEIVDMVRAMPTGLAVIDASTAMEGDGPTGGTLVDMGLIVAGTSPLAADMVAAHLMGIEPEEVPTFALAHQVGMTPRTLDEIEIRGVPMADARRPFARPDLLAWTDINKSWGVQEL